WRDDGVADGEIIHSCPGASAIRAAAYILVKISRGKIIATGNVQITSRIRGDAVIVAGYAARVNGIVERRGPGVSGVGAGHNQTVAYPGRIVTVPGSKQNPGRRDGQAEVHCGLAGDVLKIIDCLPGLGDAAVGGKSHCGGSRQVLELAHPGALYD